MPLLPRFPTSLTRRFALAAAGLAAAALVLTSLASWWMLDRQNEEALQELSVREQRFYAQTLSLNLTALAGRMREISASTILATGLVDSAGRETYLQPFLAGVRQINGIPVQVLFTDFEGREIASNNGSFTPDQRQWLVDNLSSDRAIARIFVRGDDAELVALEPLDYQRTATPEGAVLYKVSLKSLQAVPGLRLRWGPQEPGGQARAGTPVAVPPVFAPLGFRVEGDGSLAIAGAGLSMTPQYLLMGLIAVLMFVVVVLAGWRLADLLTQDMRRLQLFSGGLIRDGLTPERVSLDGSEEVALVASSINQMLDRLSEQQETLLREDRKLKELTDVLKLADKRKDEFLAMLAHELRNPLAPIMTGAETLKRLGSGDDRVARTGEIITQQALHMTRIIDDLLDVSRVTRGLVTLQQEDLDFASVVAVAVEQIRPLIDLRHHHLNVWLPGGPLSVRGDKARLVQVVSNLLNNAAKYTPDGGLIDLRVELQGPELVMSVTDNGAGISTELMPEIFDLFTQGERTSDRRHGGLGLGLALVRSLLEQHGGRVTASSQGPGLGSTFTLHLPSAAAPHAVVDTPQPVKAAQAAPLKIQLVDDNRDAAQTLAMLLELDGHHVGVSYDGQTTLALAAQQCPDVYVLDIGLPDMDGTELAQRLRAQPQHEHVVMVALTGYGQASDRSRSLAAGFSHHLVKPVNYAELSKLLGEVQPRDQDQPATVS